MRPLKIIVLLFLFIFSSAKQGFAQEIIIGTQIWLVKNLDVSTYRNGDSIPQVQDANTWATLKTGAWCYYENDPKNGTIYGKLYNWYAVNDPRGLAPEGYHVPSNNDWNLLTKYLGGLEVAGIKMKSITNWFPPSLDSLTPTNTSKFTALPGGYRYNDGQFNGIGKDGLWWTSSDGTDEFTWNRSLYYNENNVSWNKYFSKRFGISVRCLKNN